MPHFLRQRDPQREGHFLMIEATAELLGQSVPQQPASPTLAPGSRAKRYVCTACTPHSRFASVGVLSMHFQRRHKDLVEDRNSWRSYMETDDSGADGK